MKKRNLSRIKVMIELYQYDLLKGEDNIDEFEDLLKEMDEECDYDIEFANNLYHGVIENLTKIDHTIALYLDHYTLDRVSYCDRSLLRIGAYELLFTDTPSAIIINEIVNLSKEYTQIDNFPSSSLNNAVLDRIAKSLGK